MCEGRKCRLNTWTLGFLWQHREIVRVFVRQLLVSPRSRHSRQEAKSREWGLQSEHPDVLGYSCPLWQEHSGESKFKCSTFDSFANLLKIFANDFPFFWFLLYLFNSLIPPSPEESDNHQRSLLWWEACSPPIPNSSCHYIRDDNNESFP